jgi:hypothetical protein
LFAFFSLLIDGSNVFGIIPAYLSNQKKDLSNQKNFFLPLKNAGNFPQFIERKFPLPERKIRFPEREIRFPERKI